MNITEILRAHAESRPDAAAIIETRNGRDFVLTFFELERQSSLAAARFRQAGLNSGDAALVFVPMSAQLYVAMLALFRIGAVAMFLDPSAGREHIERCCALNPPRAFIGTPKAHLLMLGSSPLRRIPNKFVTSGWLPWARSLQGNLDGKTDSSIHQSTNNTPALLTFTSGSTGQPKAAVRSHGFLLAQHRALERCLHLKAGDVDLTTLPVFVLANLASGVTSLIPDADLRHPGFINAAPVVAQIKKHRPVSAVASPAFLERLIEHCHLRGELLESFRKIFTGGAPVFPQLLDRLQTVAPHADAVAVYGSTEAEPIAHIARNEMSDADIAAMVNGGGLLAGKPVSEIHLRILRQQWGKPIAPMTTTEFDAMCVSEGSAGEIVVSGAHVLSGYLHGHGDEETKFKVDGVVWHRTGDAGYLDADGRLWLLGRCAARIEDGRGELYPFTVECAVSSFAEIRRSAVIAHNARRILCIERRNPKSSLDLAGIRKTLEWAHLDEIRIFPAIPVDKRHNAKIDYPALRQLLQNER
jgi:acyl-CoA synthetase (AMP-forming)/AMP-acid ligase II